MATRVLIVEDDPAIASLIAGILKLEGYESATVAEGRRVLDVLRSDSFDLVVLDVMLPGLDGVSIMQAIRDEPATETLPVVMLTAKVDDETIWAGWRAGCNYYMTKPFEPEELIQIVRQLKPPGARRDG